jgi:hypothetical protein
MVNLSQAPSGRSNPGLWSRARFAAVLLPGMALALGCAGTNSSSSAPTITSFTPTSGSYATSVTVTGTGFSSGVTGAAVGGAAVTTAGTVSGDTSVTFLVPAAAVTGVVSVTTSGGTGSSGTMFVVVPSVTGTASPASGPIKTLVTLNGYGLGVPGIASITLVGPGSNPTPIPVTIVTQTANKITFNIPESATPGASTIVLTPSVVDGGTNVDVSFTVQSSS